MTVKLQKTLDDYQMEFPQWLTQFVSVYEKLDKENIELLQTLYHPELIFQDPVHQIRGLDSYISYCKFMYSNTTYCRFKIDDVIYDGSSAGVYWVMVYCHPQLNSGNEIKVEGHTQLKGEGNLVTYHRDYLDMGAMVYEHAPILGRLIRWLKNRLMK